MESYDESSYWFRIKYAKLNSEIEEDNDEISTTASRYQTLIKEAINSTGMVNNPVVDFRPNGMEPAGSNYLFIYWVIVSEEEIVDPESFTPGEFVRFLKTYLSSNEYFSEVRRMDEFEKAGQASEFI
jgi:hypothetical protein